MTVCGFWTRNNFDKQCSVCGFAARCAERLCLSEHPANLVAARLSLAADLREAGPVRHSLTAHQAAKPQERGDHDYNYQALVEHY
jgi:hypothetical protein